LGHSQKRIDWAGIVFKQRVNFKLFSNKGASIFAASHGHDQCSLATTAPPAEQSPRAILHGPQQREIHVKTHTRRENGTGLAESLKRVSDRDPPGLVECFPESLSWVIFVEQQRAVKRPSSPDRMDSRTGAMQIGFPLRGPKSVAGDRLELVSMLWQAGAQGSRLGPFSFGQGRILR